MNPHKDAEFTKFTNAMKDILKVSKTELQRRIGYRCPISQSKQESLSGNIRLKCSIANLTLLRNRLFSFHGKDSMYLFLPDVTGYLPVQK